MEVARDAVGVAGGGTVTQHMGFGMITAEDASPDFGRVCVRVLVTKGMIGTGIP